MRREKPETAEEMNREWDRFTPKTVTLPIDIPRAKNLLDMDATAAAKQRWKWGEKHLASDQRMECNDGRNPLLEAIEEGLDQINYLGRVVMTDTPTDHHAHHLVILRDGVIHSTNSLMRIAKERGYGDDS